MNMIKFGIILVITISLTVGISSGIFDSMSYVPSGTSFGIFDYYGPELPKAGEYDWVPYSLYDELVNNTWKPFNLYDWLNPQPVPGDSNDSPSSWKPPLPVLPEPLPLPNQEIKNMQSQLSSMKNVLYFG